MRDAIKKFFLAVSITASLSVTAQSYTFNYMLTSEHRHMNSDTFHVYSNSEFIVKHGGKPINSKNPAIEFKFDHGMGGEQIAVIQDGDRKLRHYFKLFRDPGYGETGFRLEYVRTARYKERNSPVGKFTIVHNKDLIYDIKVDVNDTNKHHLTVNLVENIDDLMHTFIIDGAGNIESQIIAELKRNLDPSKNYFISEYISRYIPGSTFHKINMVKKINFTVKLPDTKKIRKLMAISY